MEKRALEATAASVLTGLVAPLHMQGKGRGAGKRKPIEEEEEEEAAEEGEAWRPAPGLSKRRASTRG